MSKRVIATVTAAVVLLSIAALQRSAASATAASASGSFVSVTPTRLLDTRTGDPVAGTDQISVSVTGLAGVPSSGVSAVVINLTATNALGPGYITAFADSTTRPTASSLNLSKGRTIANLVVAPVGADGKVALYNGSASAVDLLVDISGYYLAGAPTEPGTFGSVAPSRLLDTRSNSAVTGHHQVTVSVTGQAGVPDTGVTAVVLNVTATSSLGPGYITAFADGTTRPTASNLNLAESRTIANLVVAPVGADGKVALYNGSASPTDLIADVSGYYIGGAPTLTGEFGSVAPARLLDTRSGAAVGGGHQISLPVTGRAEVPASGVSAVILNVTATGALGSGYLTAFADGAARPNASNVNFAKGSTVANLVVAPVGDDGKVALFSGSTSAVDLVVDISGYYLGTPVRRVRTFGDGTYRIGADIPAGTYRTHANSAGCYWERLSGFSGEFEDIIANNLTDTHDVVTISATDKGFSTSGCGTWSSDLGPLTQSPSSSFADGKWIVGTDIAPGTWRAAGGSDCYWERLSGFSGDFDDIIANDLGPTKPVLTIAPGDAGFDTSDCGTWSLVD